MGVDIKGTVVVGDSMQNFSSGLRTYLKGRIAAHVSNTVTFSTEEARVTSDFLNDQECYNLEHQFNQVTLSFAPKEGALYLTDTIPVPVISIGGWDLFRNFARVLPILPEHQVQEGEKWDRERQFPVETSHGSAIGHLYQSFTFDSLVTPDSASLYAAVSWLFSYRIEPVEPDSSGALKKLPLEGNGTGVAQIDLNKKRLKMAHAVFEASSKRGTSAPVIGWNETIHLEYLE